MLISEAAMRCRTRRGSTIDDPKERTTRTAAGDHAMIVQKICPVRGESIAPAVSTDYNGRRIYFCCKGCIEQFEKDPSRFLGKLGENSVPPDSWTETDP